MNCRHIYKAYAPDQNETCFFVAHEGHCGFDFFPGEIHGMVPPSRIGLDFKFDEVQEFCQVPERFHGHMPYLAMELLRRKVMNHPLPVLETGIARHWREFIDVIFPMDHIAHRNC